MNLMFKGICVLIFWLHYEGSATRYHAGNNIPSCTGTVCSLKNHLTFVGNEVKWLWYPWYQVHACSWSRSLVTCAFEQKIQGHMAKIAWMRSGGWSWTSRSLKVTLVLKGQWLQCAIYTLYHISIVRKTVQDYPKLVSNCML